MLITDLNKNVWGKRNEVGGMRPTLLGLWGYTATRYVGAGLSGAWCEGAGRYLLGNGYRCLQGPLMRFVSPDSLSPFGAGGLNSYAYCGGDPVNLIDPSGHAPYSLISKAFKRNIHTLERVSEASRAIVRNLPHLPITVPAKLRKRLDEQLLGHFVSIAPYRQFDPFKYLDGDAEQLTLAGRNFLGSREIFISNLNKYHADLEGTLKRQLRGLSRSQYIAGYNKSIYREAMDIFQREWRLETRRQVAYSSVQYPTR